MPKPTAPAAALSPAPKLFVQPDAPDLRDRLYTPSLRPLPAKFNPNPHLKPAVPVKDQGRSNACTGFALSALVEYVLQQSNRTVNATPNKKLGLVSPYMLYSFARRYDEFPGDVNEDTGSSARAAMKAWHKHGAASVAVWDQITPPDTQDWINDAFSRPLGAYYRVDHQCLPDIHAALTETGVLYVTSAIHGGWNNVDSQTGTIPCDRDTYPVGGHAYLLVGYDESGFWIQNSWGTGWGLKGFAHLLYSDWNRHGWDVWVAQAGVQTSLFLGSLSAGLSLKAAANRSGTDRLLSSNEAIRAQQIAPFIINLENNGELSSTGSYGSEPRDFDLLAEHYLPSALNDWEIDPNDPDEPIHLAIYAHGGLTPEKGAAATAAQWIPQLYRRKIFPLFIMWETGALDTVGDIVADAAAAALQRFGPAGRGVREMLIDWLDDRIESAVSGIGTSFWDEMKQNAAAASQAKDGGLRHLYAAFKKKTKATPVNLLNRLRIHLIGHSAGSCVHAHLLPRLVKAGLAVEGLYFMAPALRVDEFQRLILPHYQSGKVTGYTQFHLSKQAELDDACGPYQKSLLWLVSNAFERDVRRPAHDPKQPLCGRPILGMEVFIENWAPAHQKPNAHTVTWDFLVADPTRKPPHSSGATTHGGFGTEPLTMESILHRIETCAKAAGPVAPASGKPASKTAGKTTAAASGRQP